MSRGCLKSLWCLTLVAGCGMPATQEAPPLDELTLRDAMLAHPAVVLVLPPDVKQGLVARIEDAEHAQQDALLAKAAPVRAQHPLLAIDSVADAVTTFDAARADRDEDALVFLTADRTQAQPSVAALTRHELAAGTTLAPLPALELDDPTVTTHDAESRSLAGDAGTLLAETLAETGATRLVRVTQWPAAIVAADDVLYVNASWLVALAPPEPAPSIAFAPPPRTAPALPAIDAGTTPPPPPPSTSGSSSRCSVADTDASTGRRALFIITPLLIVLGWGHRRSWKKRFAQR